MCSVVMPCLPTCRHGYFLTLHAIILEPSTHATGFSATQQPGQQAQTLLSMHPAHARICSQVRKLAPVGCVPLWRSDQNRLRATVAVTDRGHRLHATVAVTDQEASTSRLRATVAVRSENKCDLEALQTTRSQNE